MASLNKVFMIGNLTRDPELRYTPSGLAVTTFTIASNRSYKMPSGEKKEEATFMRVVAWGKRAEVCGEYLSKGSSVFVEGRIQTRAWQGQDGAQRNTVEIVANNIQFIGARKISASQSDEAHDEAAQEPPDIAPEVDMPGGKTREEEIPF